jgi:hypothetical protein
VDNIRFTEPPENPQSGNRIDWKGALSYLRTRPNEWALVGEGVSTPTATALRQGRMGGAQPGEFEVRSVARADLIGQRADIYVRYIGQQEAF